MRRTLAVLLAALSFGGGAVACGEEDVERGVNDAAQEAEEAGKDAKEAGEDAAKDAKDAGEDAVNEAEDAAGGGY